MYACMHVCMYACMYACMDVCMYVWMYACMELCAPLCPKMLEKMKSSWDWKHSKTERGGLELKSFQEMFGGTPPKISRDREGVWFPHSHPPLPPTSSILRTAGGTCARWVSSSSSLGSTAHPAPLRPSSTSWWPASDSSWRRYLNLMRG